MSRLDDLGAPAGRLSSGPDWRALFCAGLVGLGISIFLIGRLIFSDFSILDDHQIIAWLGDGFWSRVGSTEIAHFGSSARFRPLLYFTLALESWLFGAKPFPYHLIQIF